MLFCARRTNMPEPGACQSKIKSARPPTLRWLGSIRYELLTAARPARGTFLRRWIACVFGNHGAPRCFAAEGASPPPPPPPPPPAPSRPGNLCLKCLERIPRPSPRPTPWRSTSAASWRRAGRSRPAPPASLPVGRTAKMGQTRNRPPARSSRGSRRESSRWVRRGLVPGSRDAASGGALRADGSWPRPRRSERAFCRPELVESPSYRSPAALTPAGGGGRRSLAAELRGPLAEILRFPAAGWR